MVLLGLGVPALATPPAGDQSPYLGRGQVERAASWAASRLGAVSR